MESENKDFYVRY